MSVTSDSFLRDVAQHRMTIKLDQSLYRHLVFRNPATFNQWFEIITWPGKLAISGDMGSWIFARVEDMFTFFRMPAHLLPGVVAVNPHYWAQKIEAEDRISHTRRFSPDVFASDALEALKAWDWEPVIHSEAVELLEDTLTGVEGPEQHYEALRGFAFRGARFDEIPDGMVFTDRFLWACHAIVWAIQQYDAAKEAR